MKTIKTQIRGHEARLREHCTPLTSTRREIKWLTTETPNRWTKALMIVSRTIETCAHFETGGEKVGRGRGEGFYL